MSISDEELVRRLESVPMVDGPDFREPVLRRVRAGFSRPGDRLKPVRTLVLGLAWAAAVVIVIGIAFQRSSGPRPQSAAATMAAAPAELTVQRIGDRFAVRSSVKGDLDWDRAKLTKVEVWPDGTVILQRRPGASGKAFIRLSVGGREVLKTPVVVDTPTF